MFYEQRLSVPDTRDSLRTEYDDDLRSALEHAGLEQAETETGIGRPTLEALQDGEAPTLTLEEAAQIQSLQDGEPDPETIVELAGEHLLLGMTTAVIDVDTLAADVDGDLGATEIQQKIERRAPMTFEEYVAIQHAIVDRGT
ncbi:DUF5791 family protein [Natronosalvus halobius]|uniref:DUF5791 family protein n=1 Tax=Natronosalvus halobius TaxID=2953746 RepID=UPI00209C861F|nr:DUF5791 family protein [Natronosalvus halobius]USZ73346.1 DUF5791 family protein [Natronosalvus halobius]